MRIMLSEQKHVGTAEQQAQKTSSTQAGVPVLSEVEALEVHDQHVRHRVEVELLGALAELAALGTETAVHAHACIRMHRRATRRHAQYKRKRCKKQSGRGKTVIHLHMPANSRNTHVRSVKKAK